RALGAVVVPETVAELGETIEAYRPELEASEAALDTVRFLLREPPLPLAARPPYALLAAGAVSTLPGWARDALGVDTWFRRTLGGPAGTVATRAVRWGMGTSEKTRVYPRAGVPTSTDA
ncbi:MAG TPA: oxygenase MpaB family protein, partial [Isoptericola sp.]|nr:oxygenase MpaB family protein [Isoptericola sp.]